MKPLVILVTAFIAALVANYFFRPGWDFVFAGNIAMSGMLLFTSLGHFLYADGMAMMLPPSVPARKALVLFTGLVEIAAAIGLLLPSFRHVTALLLIVFFILILPANIYAAMHKINLEKASEDGNGVRYLWFRVPLQFLFIGWVWFFSLSDKASG